MEIHCSWVGLSCLLMLLSKGAHTASVGPRENVKEHGFDLGPLQCCSRPKDSEICPEISNYIPCTVANDMESRETMISSTVATHPFEANCSDSIREVLCEQNFPTCVINADGSHEVLLPARSTCKEKIGEACGSALKDVIEATCSLYEAASTNYSVGNCSASNITLNHCTVDWYLPEWIVQYVKKIDVELDNARTVGLLADLDDSCWEKLKQVRCKSVGRCWALGDRLERIVSIETCNEALTW